jgi:hypothetical protein
VYARRPLHLTKRTLVGKWVEENPEIVAAGAAAALGAALAPVLVPLILSGVGFGAGGVAAGSLAAGMQAAIGSVAGGSLFALAQSVGAGGAVPLVGYLASAGLGLSAALLGDIVGWVAQQLAEGGLQEHIKQIADLPRMLEEHLKSE